MQNWKIASSHLVEWNALKVVVGGASIGQRVGARQEIHQQLVSLEQRMITLEQEATTDPQKKAVLQEACISHAELLENLRIIDYRAYQLRKHTEAARRGTLLARLVRDRPDPPIIAQIHTQEGQFVTTQKYINTAFYFYLKQLYSPSAHCETHHINAFLHDLTLPTLPDDIQAEIDGPITQQEICMAIKSINRNKAPGIDGLPIELHHTYADILIPKLETV